MNEAIYDALWQFTLEHKDIMVSSIHETKAVAILRLYQSDAPVPLTLDSASMVEEAIDCIRMALQFAFPSPDNTNDN